VWRVVVFEFIYIKAPRHPAPWVEFNWSDEGRRRRGFAVAAVPLVLVGY
jgi:hypothetical protein